MADEFGGPSSVVSGECGYERTAPIKSRITANLHVGEVPVTTRVCEWPEGTLRTRGQMYAARGRARHSASIGLR